MGQKEEKTQQDSIPAWRKAVEKIEDNKKLLILEFGVGSRNRMIKLPFMQTVAQEPDAFYITFNKGDLYIPQIIQEKSLGVDGDLKEQLAAIKAVME